MLTKFFGHTDIIAAIICNDWTSKEELTVKITDGKELATGVTTKNVTNK